MRASLALTFNPTAKTKKDLAHRGAFTRGCANATADERAWRAEEDATNKGPERRTDRCVSRSLFRAFCSG